MYKDLLAQTTLLALPMVALFIFLAVFFFVVLRALTEEKKLVAARAGMPLEEEDRHGA